MKKRIISMFLAVCIIVSAVYTGAVTAFAGSAVLYGDADADGKVDLLDVNLIEGYLSGEKDAADKINKVNADVNADGAIDAEDIRLIKEYLVGNISLTPILHSISFNTDGAESMPVIMAGEGYTYKGKIATPSKDGFIFVHWLKPNGEIYYQDEQVITGDLVLTAGYEALESRENLNITTFSLENQPGNLSFKLAGNFATAEEVKANITLVSKDGSDPVETDVKKLPGGKFEVYAPDGFNAGASYELTLGEGLSFDGKDEMFRTANFIIKKAQGDNLKYDADVIFIKDTAEMNYTVGGKTVPVLEASFLSNETGKEKIKGSFSLAGRTLSKGDIVCIYENILIEKGKKIPALGDLNGDYNVDIRDLVMLKKVISSKADNSSEGKGDVNKDGMLNSEDIILLKKALIMSA